MSPLSVCAWISTVSVKPSGLSRASRELRTFPDVELTSSHAAVPARMPTSRTPEVVVSSTVPRTTSSMRTPP